MPLRLVELHWSAKRSTNDSRRHERSWRRRGETERSGMIPRCLDDEVEELRHQSEWSTPSKSWRQRAARIQYKSMYITKSFVASLVYLQDENGGGRAEQAFNAIYFLTRAIE
jgi:hypothetical protein